MSANYFKAMGIPLRWGRAFQRRGSVAGAASHHRQRSVCTSLLSRRETRLANASRWVMRNPPYSTIVGVVANHIQPGRR